MKHIPTLALLAIGQLSPAPGLKAVETLNPKVAVRLVQPRSQSDLAGRYTPQSPELEKRVGPFLGGDDLYLFPDGSYIYAEWDDLTPETIYDKGRWKEAGGIVRLVSDADIKWKPAFDRSYVVVQRAQRPSEVMLVGLAHDVAHVARDADNPELALLIVGKLRVGLLNSGTAPSVKAKLMKDAWRPEFFRKRETSREGPSPRTLT